jgi:hypothetical protein
MRTFRTIFIGLTLLGIMSGCADVQVNTAPVAASKSEGLQYQAAPQNLPPAATQAEKDGRKLYDAYLKGPVKVIAIEKEKAKINDFCDFNYETYVVDSNTYFIAGPPSSKSIIWGRHYKIAIDGVVSKSTKSCLSMSIPDDAVSLLVTDTISDTPTEFHVFLSLKYKIPINIVTPNGEMWKVKEGMIH